MYAVGKQNVVTFFLGDPLPCRAFHVCFILTHSIALAIRDAFFICFVSITIFVRKPFLRITVQHSTPSKNSFWSANVTSEQA